ncbi:unnamed protein product [Closterium sp. NIES-54]
MTTYCLHPSPLPFLLLHSPSLQPLTPTLSQPLRPLHIGVSGGQHGSGDGSGVHGAGRPLPPPAARIPPAHRAARGAHRHALHRCRGALRLHRHRPMPGRPRPLTALLLPSLTCSQAFASLIFTALLTAHVLLNFPSPLPPLPPTLGWSNPRGVEAVLFMPLSLLATTLFNEAMWQRKAARRAGQSSARPAGRRMGRKGRHAASRAAHGQQGGARVEKGGAQARQGGAQQAGQRYGQGSAMRQRQQRGAADLGKGEMLLNCYTDASLNSVKADGTSIGGYVCLFGGGAVSWRSKKQNEVGLSSCETEYMALHHGVKEVVWLRRLLEEIGVCLRELAVMFCDNELAVKLAKNACLHGMTKHIRPKWHWVRRLLDKEVRLEIVKTYQQAADILTKLLAEPEHWKGMKLVGMSVH